LIDEHELAVLETLFLPFGTGALEWQLPAAFLRARYGAPLAAIPRARELVCEQSFRPAADALEQNGLTVVPELAPHAQGFALVLVLPPRQREEARALLARAVGLAGEGGRVVAAAGNNTGARSFETDLAQLSGTVTSQSKHKCRVFWTSPLRRAELNSALLKEWSELDAPRRILDERFISRPGLFAWDRVDAASELLASELPTTLSGRAADLGAGFGYLTRALLERCAGISAADVYEAEHRALALARTNLADISERIPMNFHWHDVTRGLPHRYDVIVTNPPFHTSSGRDDPGLGRRFITAAANALNPRGRFWLVANRHLPYEAVLNASFGSVRTVVERYGFKIIEAVRR
jgi:16S rRNA (guanine1207-N2)-methyltransferase